MTLPRATTSVHKFDADGRAFLANYFAALNGAIPAGNFKLNPLFRNAMSSGPFSVEARNRLALGRLWRAIGVNRVSYKDASAKQT
jgi:hypothetical protein